MKPKTLKTLKTVAIVVLLLILCVRLSNLNMYKDGIEAKISESLHKTVRLHGDIKIGWAGWLPAVTFKRVQMDDLYLDSLSLAVPLKKEGGWALFSSIDGIRTGKREIGDLGILFAVYEGGFETKKLKGALHHGGVIEGTAQMANGTFHAEAQARKLDYANFAPGLKGGDAKADILVDARGTDFQQIRRDMDGHFMMVGGEGALSGKILEMWGADALASIFIQREDVTKINCTVVDFEIRNGIAVSRNLIIDTDRVTVFGKGSIDLARGYVDIVFTPQPKSRTLVDLGAPVRLRGPFGNITSRVEPMGATLKLGKLLLGFVNPAAPLVPYLLQGTSEADMCLQYLEG